jgi:hypothetical protein
MVPRLRPSELREYASPIEEGCSTPEVFPPMQDQAAYTGIVGRFGLDLQSLLPELQQDTYTDILSNGQWSLHEMIAHLLHLTGPAKVWVTSWGISQEPLKAVIRLVDTKHILRLQMLFDHRVRLQCPEAYQTLVEMAGRDEISVHLTKVHAKTVVITNDSWSLVLRTSANLTNNPRIESYSLTTHKSAERFNRGWIEQVMQGAQPFEAE